MEREISYRFDFSDGSKWRYIFRFDKDHIIIPDLERPVMTWTKLDTNKCPHCPLNSDTYPQCPVARNLDQVVEGSKAALSCTKALVTINTCERTYSKECATQEGLLSLFGVIMASSGCPHLDWLRPLARFHLPFASMDETLFRVLALELLDRYFKDSTGTLDGVADHLKERYKGVEGVNHAFIKRIRSYCSGDADKNAIAALDVFVQIFDFHMSSDFKSIKYLFGN